MSKKKIDITNIEIKNIDLNIIKDFIDIYDDCQEKINEYNELCNRLINDKKIKEHNSDKLETSISYVITDIINETTTCKDEKKLEILKKEYEKYDAARNDLKKYRSIIKVYNDMYSGSLSKYFDNNELDAIIYKYVEEKYSKYTPAAKEEQRKIEKTNYLKREKCTITQIYINIKYLYEVCSKIYENTEKTKVKKGLFSMIKTVISKLKLKKSITEIDQDYVKDNEIHLAKIKSDKTIFIDLESLEKNIEFYKMFKEPISKYINENHAMINRAIKEAEKEPEKIAISENTTILTRKERIDELKKMKDNLKAKEEPKEIIIPTKTA